MFCPHCGTQLPDSARFCAKCGTSLTPSTTQPTTSPQTAGGTPNADTSAYSAAYAPSQSPSTTSRFSSVVRGFSGTIIAAIVITIIALIFGLMPWYESSGMLKLVGTIGSGSGSIINSMGGSANYSSFENSYAPWQLGVLSGEFASYGSDGATAGVALIPTFIGWLVGFVLTVIGVVRLFTSRGSKRSLLYIGLIVLGATALIWTIVYTTVFVNGNYASGFATSALICAIASAIGIILLIVSKRTT